MKTGNWLPAMRALGTFLIILTAGCAGTAGTPLSVAKEPETQLDLVAMESRLRGSDSIGEFTELVLRSEVGDLLHQFRVHHQVGRNSSVTALRQPYNMLILKVLAIIQDSDPVLARSISGAREVIWGILADPDTFNTLT